MKSRWLALAGIICLTAVLWLLLFRTSGSHTDMVVAAKSLSPAAAEAPMPATAVKHPAETSISAPVPALATPVPVRIQRPAAEVAAQLAPAPEPVSGLPPMTVLENMRSVFHQYNSRFGGNPIGNNAEITAALNGRNAKQVKFINPEDGLRVNERGELVDNWGTPFFFHQISGTVMEIYSAGPDKKMWTSDDLMIK